MDRQELDGLSREELIELAAKHDVPRPRTLTQAELIDELLSRTARDDRDRARARGWLGRARDLIAQVIQKGLHLPEAARALGGRPSPRLPNAKPPLPTVTLAEIYAAQGHLQRAIGVLDEVLGREPDHAEAARLREVFYEQSRRPRSRASEPEIPSGAAAPEQSDEAAPSAVAEPAAASDAAAPSEPARVLPPEALPSRYEVDEVVAIGVDPHAIYLYWELRPTTLEHARSQLPDGALTLRVLTIRPSWDGPLTTSRDVRVEAAYGDMTVRDLDAGAIVRVSLGWLHGEQFRPLAIANELTTARATIADAEDTLPLVGRWRPVSAAAESARASDVDDGDEGRTWPRGARPIGRAEDDELWELEDVERTHVADRPSHRLGGASELGWDDLNEEERALYRARKRARELLGLAGGASDLARRRAS